MAPPSEFDLRAALRDGEGDEPDINQVMIAGAARRAQRRSRILSAAVVIVAVGGLSAAAAEFGGSGNSRGSADSAAMHGGAVGQLAPSAPKALANVDCPSTAPHYSLDDVNGDRSSAYTSATTPLFTERVSSVVVCAYGPAFHALSGQLRSPARLELLGRQAKQVAHSLETAPTAVPSASCSSAPTGQYALIPVDASGDTGKPVTAQLAAAGCGAVVTNGTAIRYGWQPPPGVAAKLDNLSPSPPPESPEASPTANPSPTPSPTS